MSSTDYDWIDPVANAHPRHYFLSSGVSAPYLFPFPFSFYENEYISFYMTSKGLAGLINEDLETSDDREALSVYAPNTIIAPFWDALAVVQNSRAYIGTVGAFPDQKVVATWVNMAHRDDPDVRFSFQVIFCQSASETLNNELIFQYHTVSEPNQELGSGLSATVALKDTDGVLTRIYSVNGSEEVSDGQALLFRKPKIDDTTAPAGAVELRSASDTNLAMSVRFNEMVSGLTTPEVQVTGNIPGATITDLAGSGERFEFTVDGVDQLGYVSVGVVANAVTDPSGNPNVAVPPMLYVVPFTTPLFNDDMERGPDNWTPSSGVYPVIREDGWEYGTPANLGWAGPPAPPSGEQCWGTVMDGDYYNSMRATLDSRAFLVGEKPVLEFQLWYDLEYGYDFGYVEVHDGAGWIDVTPNGRYNGWVWEWERQRIVLDPAVFGNRAIRVRFRAESDASQTAGGMFVDDVQVSSQLPPGVWVSSYTPTNAAPGATESLVFEAYNSSTTTYHNVTALISSRSPGLTIVGNPTVSYGDLTPGQRAIGTPVTATFGAAAEFDSSHVRIAHEPMADEGPLDEQTVTIHVTGVLDASGSSRLTATTSAGVRDWQGNALQGDGGPQSSLFQLIYAGADGLIDPPRLNGAAGGDDALLYVASTPEAFGRIGTGNLIPSDFGRFTETFEHGLRTSTPVYVRAWDGASYASSVAYGDSMTHTITLTDETIDFGAWIVGVPIDTKRDLNGDTIPDGYMVTIGGDATAPVAPLDADWRPLGVAGELSGSADDEFSVPCRVVYHNGYVYVSDSENNRIQVWAADLSSNVSSYGVFGTNSTQLSAPVGVAVDEANSRLIVADSRNHRVVVLDIDPGSGALTFHSLFGSYGTGWTDLSSPQGIAVDSASNIYVADKGNDTVKRFSSNGAPLGRFGALSSPRGICVDRNYVYVADTDNHRIVVFSTSGSQIATVGDTGDAAALLQSPYDVKVGPGGRLFVADTMHHRVQLYAPTYEYLASFKPPSGSRGSAAGELNMPRGVFPLMDASGIYVADTVNNRVQLLVQMFDQDGDGMDDLWEDANGLDCTDPSDGATDLDDDGVSNLGEYRAGTDPNLRDTNGDGISDLFSMCMPIDPNAIFPPHVGVHIAELGQPQPPVDVLTWEAEADAIYKMEMSLDLPDAEWLPQATVTVSQAGVVSWTNAAPPRTIKRFYRIRKEL